MMQTTNSVRFCSAYSLLKKTEPKTELPRWVLGCCWWISAFENKNQIRRKDTRFLKEKKECLHCVVGGAHLVMHWGINRSWQAPGTIRGAGDQAPVKLVQAPCPQFYCSTPLVYILTVSVSWKEPTPALLRLFAFLTPELSFYYSCWLGRGKYPLCNCLDLPPSRHSAQIHPFWVLSTHCHRADQYLLIVLQIRDRDFTWELLRRKQKQLSASHSTYLHRCMCEVES